MSTGLIKYFDNAMGVLDKFGLRKPAADEESQLASLLQQAVHVDEPKVLAVSRVVQYQGSFNTLVRENIEAMDIHTDYNEITKRFNSIREDSSNLVKQLGDGKIDFKEKISNWYMKFRRGTTHERFEEIKKFYVDVSNRTKEQLERENTIMEAYMDFRLAIKEAEILSHEVAEKQKTVLKEAESNFKTKTDAVSNYEGDSDSDKSRLQLARDESKRTYDKENKTYQLIKDVAEDLTVGYNVGETLVMKLKQTHDLKDRVFTRAVSFFTTNEHVFTTMDAVYNSQQGLHEQTQTLNAMTDGAEKGLEDIAELGNSLEKAALKAGYGASINAESVQKLVDSVASFQEESYGLIEQYREEATNNSKEVARIVDEGKQRVANALEKYLDVKIE